MRPLRAFQKRLWDSTSYLSSYQGTSRVREALPEMEALGWTVAEFAAGKYDITRPKAAG